MNIFEKSSNALGSLYVVYESPVRQETENTLGVSHLLEHMICCSLDDIEEKFDQHGLTMNAQTSEHEVIFYLTGLEEELAQFRNIFVERITNYRPRLEDFNKELPIVQQEYADYYSDPGTSIYMNYLSMEHGFVGAIGAKSALDNLTFETAVEFFNKAFAAPTKIITVGESQQEYGTTFGAVQSPAKFAYRHLDTNAPIVPSSVPMFVASQKVFDEEMYHSSLISAMLCLGLKSPMYSELREKQKLCYWLSAAGQRVEDGLVSFVSTSVNEDKVTAAGTAMMEVLGDYKKHLTKERFDLVMQNRKIAKKISETNAAASAYAKHLVSADPRWSFTKNVDRITYDSTVAFYERTMNPAKIEWRQFSQADILKMV